MIYLVMELLSILLLFFCSWKSDALNLLASSRQSSTIGSRSISLGDERTSATSIHLLSLPKSSNPDPPQISKIIDWKREALGDGGVYWDRRPKSLAALNSALAEHVLYRLTTDGELKWNVSAVECAVVSTCARFEILLCIQSQEDLSVKTHDMTKNLDEVMIDAVAECLAIQMINLHRFRWMLFWKRRDSIERISTDTYSKWINNTNSDYMVQSLGIQAKWAHPLRNLIAFTTGYKQRKKFR